MIGEKDNADVVDMNYLKEGREDQRRSIEGD